MKKYDLIIFDCDGTLIDSEPLTCEVISGMLGGMDISASTQECIDLFAGKTIGHILRYIEDHGVKVDPDEFEQDYRQRSFQIFDERLKPVEGVIPFLESLEVDFCVASNGPQIKMARTLPASGLNKYFVDNIYSAYDVQVWKPEPDLFLHVCKERHCSPQRAIVIEDSWSGAMAAINAGIDVWIYNPHGDKSTFINEVPNFSQMSSLRHSLMRYL